MSVQRPGPDPQRLLPASVEHSLSDLGVRVAGGALVAIAATSWLALLSWQLRDGMSSRAVRNLLGNTGAGISDMMVHTLGIACVFAMICPMVWGLELLASVRWIPRFRVKLVAALTAVLALAGAASGLPDVPGWPLLGGAGGMLGDLVHNMTSSAMSRFGFERDSKITVLALGFGGALLLLKSLGLSLGLRARLNWTKTTPAAPNAVSAGTPATAATAKSAPADGPTKRPTVEPQLPEPPTLAPKRGFDLGVPLHPERDLPKTLDVQNLDNGTSDDTDDNARAFAERFAPSASANVQPGSPRIIPVLKTTLAKARSKAAGYRKPSVNLLRRPPAPARRHELDVDTGASTLLEVMAAFGVKGDIREARPGPVVTRYEFEPVRGTKIARIIGLADDFARELGANAVRVSTTPGRTTIGIEVPNDVRETVVLRDILESETYTNQSMNLPLALGKGIGGEPIALDLARMPHLLVAGTTGSGKSVGLNAMILSLLYHLEPTQLRLLLIDPKMLELSQYDRIPHLLHPVITDPTEATQALDWAVGEMESRYRRMAQQGTRNIESFNTKVLNAKATGTDLTRTVQTGFDSTTGKAIYERVQIDDAPMPYIVVVIDELADLMVTAGKRVEGSIQRLAQKARAAGIHLVMATQRPSVDVVTGTIKANFPVRISFRVASKIDSRTIINEPGAEQLLGHGDMLLTSGSGHHLRVHGAYVSDEEIERVTEALRDQGEPNYVDLTANLTPSPSASKGRASNVARAADHQAKAEARAHEELYAAAVGVVAGDRKASSGHLNRRLGVSEVIAAGLIERMEREGLVGAANMFGRRTIHVQLPDHEPPRARSAA